MTLKPIALAWLIAFAHGRFINVDNLSKSGESRSGRTNSVADTVDSKSLLSKAKNAEVRDPRLSEVEWTAYSVHEPNGPGTFSFGYDNAVDSAGNEHFRLEERLINGTVIGEYGYIDNAINRIVRVMYTADHRGYRAKTQFLPIPD